MVVGWRWLGHGWAHSLLGFQLGYVVDRQKTMRSARISYLYLLILMVSNLPRVSKSQEARDGALQSPRLSALKNELRHGNRSALERFWVEANGNAPLIEKFPNDEGLFLVTYLWRGGSEISSVLLQDGPPAQGQKWLARLADTDLWFRTDPVPQDAQIGR